MSELNSKLKCDTKGCKAKVNHEMVYHPGCTEECEIHTERLGHKITGFCDKHWEIFRDKYHIPCSH